MISKVIKYVGLFLIVFFSAASVFVAITHREIDNDQKIKNFMTYTSFFEDRFYDFRMKKTLKENAYDKRLILAAIDDQTLRKLGTWPIPRDNWTKLINKLNKFGAKVIAFDVFFSEMSLSCEEIPPEVEMAQAIINFQEKEGNKIILPYYLSPNSQDAFKELPESMYNFIMTAAVSSEETNLTQYFISKNAFPLKIFQDTEATIAHIEAESDPDGIFRQYRLTGNVETLYFPSFSIAAYQAYMGEMPELSLPNVAEASLKLKTGTISLNYKGEAKVRWLGGAEAFPLLSMYDILMAPDDDPKMKEIINGNIVFIGSTTYGAHDLRHTPIDTMMPGVYFHMNMTHMLLNGEFFVPESESAELSWAILIIGTLIILIVQLFNNPLIDLFTVISLVSGLFYLDTYHLIPRGYEIKLFFCFFSIISCYSWNTFLHFYLANKDKTFLKSAFGSYISPELIDDMYKSGEPPKLGGDSGIRTAFFTDIQGFSSFSEKLTATKLVELLNEYLTVMTDVLLEEKGTLDKYEGDAIIAFFGAPMPLADHASRSCLVAHRMQEELAKLREKWISEGDKWPTIVHQMRMRIGINSGEIVTGNMGSRNRMNYTMMGDSVNLAARLEESAKQYGIFTQVSKETVDMTGDQFIFRELDTIRVVGKSIPVTSFDLLGLRETAEPYLIDLAKKFKQGLETYKEKKWDKALSIFKETLNYEYQRFPELKGVKTNPSEIYIERIKEYMKNPPPEDWDGIWTLTSK